jgi:hypothetical protein
MNSADIERNNMNTYLIAIIAPYIRSYDEIKKTKIFLPKELTKLDRYNIHKLNTRDDFKTFSFDDEKGDRIIEIILSKFYVQRLFFDYQFEQPAQTEKTEKEILFDTIINFVNLNLSAEFQSYMQNM